MRAAAALSKRAPVLCSPRSRQHQRHQRSQSARLGSGQPPVTQDRRPVRWRAYPATPQLIAELGLLSLPLTDDGTLCSGQAAAPVASNPPAAKQSTEGGQPTSPQQRMQASRPATTDPPAATAAPAAVLDL